MFERFLEWREKHQKKTEEAKREQIRENANELYQVREYKGNLWLVYSGRLVCKMSYFGDKENVVDTLGKLRIDYIASLHG